MRLRSSIRRGSDLTICEAVPFRDPLGQNLYPPLRSKVSLIGKTFLVIKLFRLVTKKFIQILRYFGLSCSLFHN